MQKKSNIQLIEILANLPVRVDYLLLQDTFSNYKNPKKKIFDLKKNGCLQQIKRGQYFNLKSKYFENSSYETIANSLYFPSYVSMEWALQYYGLLMDRVTTVTSVTLLRSKNFMTPYAPYTYNHLTKKRFPYGYLSKMNNKNESFLIARPEKALLDYVNLKAKNLTINTPMDISEFLENDLRLDLNEFLKITFVDNLKELEALYHRNSKEFRILKWLINRKKDIL